MPSFKDFLDFSAAAIHNWSTWVTGTGIVGFILWVVSLVERKRGTQMKFRTYLAILLCALWFLGTFSAWRDSQGNLSHEISLLATDNSHLNTCNSDLKLAKFSAETWKDRFADEQKINTGVQSSLNENQSSVNKCVTRLIEETRPVKQVTTLRFVEMPNKHSPDNPPSKYKVWIFLVITNQRSDSFKGSFTCGSEFGWMGATGVARQATAQQVTEARLNQTRMDFSISLPWDVSEPIILSVLGDSNFDPSSCKIANNT